MTLLRTLTLIFLLPQICFAHGVEWDMSMDKSYAVKFNFADGTPMGNASIFLYGPETSDIPKSRGYTDFNGYYAFLPDAEGIWTIKASDEAGHLTVATVDVKNQENIVSEIPAVTIERAINNATKPIKIGLIVSLFINIAFIAMYFKRKKTHIA